MDNETHDNDTAKNVAIVGLALAIPVAFVGGLAVEAWAIRHIVKEKVEKMGQMLNDAVKRAVEGFQHAEGQDELDAVARRFDDDIAFLNIASRDTGQFIKPRRKAKE